MRVFPVLLALAVTACAPPMYEDSKRVAKAEKLREERDLCLIRNAHNFDDGRSDAPKIGEYTAMSCSNETSKLVEMAIPYPSRHDGDAFQQEAAFRATGYVMMARRLETDSIAREHRQSSPLE
jgi:hypothetical protein